MHTANFQQPVSGSMGPKFFCSRIDTDLYQDCIDSESEVRYDENQGAYFKIVMWYGDKG